MILKYNLIKKTKNKKQPPPFNFIDFLPCFSIFHSTDLCPYLYYFLSFFYVELNLLLFSSFLFLFFKLEAENTDLSFFFFFF